VWLKPVADATAPAPASGGSAPAASGCSEAEVMAATKLEGGPNFSCQCTMLPAATVPLPWWSPWQYLEDLTSGNVSLGRWLRGMLYMGFEGLQEIGIGGPTLRRWYDKTAKLRGGFSYPRHRGEIPAGQRTPGLELNLREGEWVRVKSHQEILATLDSNNRNRGLYFDGEMVPYCGRTLRVLKIVTRIVNEKTGAIQEFKNPCIILDGGVCEGRYSPCRLFCPRAIYTYWREIWLERVPGPDACHGAKDCQR
jgi:hypothetical protein